MVSYFQGEFCFGLSFSLFFNGFGKKLTVSVQKNILKNKKVENEHLLIAWNKTVPFVFSGCSIICYQKAFLPNPNNFIVFSTNWWACFPGSLLVVADFKEFLGQKMLFSCLQEPSYGDVFCIWKHWQYFSSICGACSKFAVMFIIHLYLFYNKCVCVKEIYVLHKCVHWLLLHIYP